MTRAVIARHDQKIPHNFSNLPDHEAGAWAFALALRANNMTLLAARERANYSLPTSRKKASA